MKEELAPKTYFWPYDVFGYLLPGMAVLVGCAVGNTWAAAMLAKPWSSMRLPDVLLALGLSYVVGHIVAGMSSFVFEKSIVSRILRWPTSHMFRDGSEGKIARAILPGYTRPYSKAFRSEFDVRFAKVFHIPPNDEHDRFWLAWSFVALRHPLAYRRGTHFLELYGFSRNVSFALLLIALLPVLPRWSAPVSAWWWTGVLLLGCFVLFVNYTKLLRRLNDEVYRAFIALDSD